MAMQCQLDATNHIRIGNYRRGHIIGGLTLDEPAADLAVLLRA